MVDEGHRGASTEAGKWLERREKLCATGFAFEYSATFGQAVAKGLTVVKAREEIKKKQFPLLLGKLFGKSKVKDLTAEEKIVFEAAKKTLTLTNDDERKACTMAMREIYAKSILFDYSYKFFYDDGYGKEFVILNLRSQDYNQEETARLYLTACLLSFYQQQYLWDMNRDKLTKFNIEKPLWVFVGNTVSSEDADVLKVLKFLAGFLKDDVQTRQWIKGLLDDTACLLDTNGHNIFRGRFTPLMGKFNSAVEVYADILKRLFNTGARQRLKVVNLKGSKGELALRVGEAEPFGLINIGDDAKFFKEAATDNNAKLFDTETDDFSGSMFDTLNSKDSTLHVLIGSRKFTEGWSSWRVSTMGLLNMGKGEGSQIIQLFGRGVRLKGEGYSLKRSTPGERPKGVHLERLETLNVFGVNAGYMGTFKDYLRDEGVTPSDEIIELDFKTRCNVPKGKLKTLTLKDGYKDNQAKGFNRTHFPWLYEVPGEFAGKINGVHIDLDLYPKLGVIATDIQDNAAMGADNGQHKDKIAFKTMALFDFDRIYLAVQAFKQREGWNNLRLERSRLIDFCLQGNDWYTLYIPQADLDIGSIADISRQEDILIRLLQDYTDRFYKALKTAYEGQFYDVVIVKEDDSALLKGYHFAIKDTGDGASYKEKIEKLQKLVMENKLGKANDWDAGQMVAICFDPHLYHPLFTTKDKAPLNNGLLPLKMRPLSFDAPSEVQFVRDLEKFYLSGPGKEIIGNRSIYLLRNAATKSKGLGFALAGNFYPDFLLWLVDDMTGKQWLSFIDPKGLRQMDLSGPKLGLYKEIKVIETNLGDPQLTLNAFIVTPTPFKDLINVSAKQEDLENHHVLFMLDGADSYLKKMFERILDDSQGLQ